LRLNSNNFIERSLIGAVNFFQGSLYAEECAGRKGFLQSIDSRIKVITILLLLLTILWAKDIIVLLWLYFFCLLLACLSYVKLKFFLKRTWIFMPIFSLFIAIPALFVLRVIASVSYVVLLSLVTRHTELLRVLRIFKIPQIFILVLGMCYRYIYLFVELISHTYLAIKSRVGFSLGHQKGQEIVAYRIANLWQRSLHLNNQVYQAMLSRGYTGEPQVLMGFKTKAKDWLWLGAVSLICIFINIYGRINL
jgi:cobalt/nickel transport system permease protein